jgi:inorganic triphosphatase YgiF
MAIERELKLTGILPKLEGVLSIAGVALTFVRTDRQINLYFDTPELTLRRAGSSLRLRRVENGASVFTWKGQSQILGAWHSKQEIEVPAGQAQSIQDLTETKILEKLGHVSLEQLVPICRFDTTRQIYALDDIGELCLDHVQIKRGQVTLETFAELELEALETADETKLQQVALTLMAMGRLEPSALSKSARALQEKGVGRKVHRL